MVQRMNVTIRYTQPLLFAGQNRRTVDHTIECSDTETSANGVPIPVETKWQKTFERIHLPVGTNSAKYEII